MAKAREFLSSKERRTKLLILAVVLEPLRALTTYLLVSARDDQDLNAPPILFDTIEPARSMFVVCAQYWSSLLRGIGGRLAFVF